MVMRNEAAAPARRRENSRPAEKIAWDFIGCVVVALAASLWLAIRDVPIGLIGFVISQYGVW